jgi:hypothetical protein
LSNILKAIKNISDLQSYHLENLFSGENTINNVGESLELFIKSAFANTLESEGDDYTELFDNIFSHQGEQNHPPDIILRDGDAIEVKKISTFGASIPLNSSYPKNKLYSDDPKITDKCKNCERPNEWQCKDIFYAVGVVNSQEIKHLSFVLGDCYAADKEVYQAIADGIESGIQKIEGPTFSETKELGRVNNVDPKGVTNLRIRGMWEIKNPLRQFEDIYTRDPNSNFELMCLMTTDKYESLPDEDQNNIELSDTFTVSDVQIVSPNFREGDDTIEQFLRCKLIKA